MTHTANQNKPKWGRRVGIGVVVLFVCGMIGCAVEFFRPHVRDFRAPTYSEFVAKAGRDYGLPRSAKDIRVVFSNVSFSGHAHVLKFTAPVEDCQKYALADFRHYDLGPSSAPEFITIAERPVVPTFFEYGIHDLSWF